MSSTANDELPSPDKPRRLTLKTLCELAVAIAALATTVSIVVQFL